MTTTQPTTPRKPKVAPLAPVRRPRNPRDTRRIWDAIEKVDRRARQAIRQAQRAATINAQQARLKAHTAAGTSPLSPFFNSDAGTFRGAAQRELRRKATRGTLRRLRRTPGVRQVMPSRRIMRRARRNPAAAAGMLLISQPLMYVRITALVLVLILLSVAVLWYGVVRPRLGPFAGVIEGTPGVIEDVWPWLQWWPGQALPSGYAQCGMTTMQPISRDRPEGGVQAVAWQAGNKAREIITAEPSEEDIREFIHDLGRGIGGAFRTFRGALEGVVGEPRRSVTSTPPSGYAPTIPGGITPATPASGIDVAARAIVAAGVHGEEAATFVAIAGAESDYVTTAANPTSSARGLWQIMLSVHDVTEAEAFDPTRAAALAVQIKNDSPLGFAGPWAETYGAGNHLPHMAEARAAVARAEAPASPTGPAQAVPAVSTRPAVADLLADMYAPDGSTSHEGGALPAIPADWSWAARGNEGRDRTPAAGKYVNGWWHAWNLSGSDVGIEWTQPVVHFLVNGQWQRAGLPTPGEMSHWTAWVTPPFSMHGSLHGTRTAEGMTFPLSSKSPEFAHGAWNSMGAERLAVPGNVTAVSIQAAARLVGPGAANAQVLAGASSDVYGSARDAGTSKNPSMGIPRYQLMPAGGQPMVMGYHGLSASELAANPPPSISVPAAWGGPASPRTGPATPSVPSMPTPMPTVPDCQPGTMPTPDGVPLNGAAPGATIVRTATGPDWTAAGSPLTAQEQALTQFLMEQVGEPYVWGGTGPDGWDCSGLLYGAFKHIGRPLRVRTAAQMWAASVQIPAEQARPGDIVFSQFGKGRGGVPNGPGHMTIALSGGKVVEAPRTGLNVRVADMKADAKVFRLQERAFAGEGSIAA